MVQPSAAFAKNSDALVARRPILKAAGARPPGPGRSRRANVFTAHDPRTLPQAACARPVSDAELHGMMEHLAARAAACAHGGLSPSMTTDPFLVSRAIFEWWWSAGSDAGPGPRRRGLARAGGGGNLDELSMDGVGGAGLVASGLVRPPPRPHAAARRGSRLTRPASPPATHTSRGLACLLPDPP